MTTAALAAVKARTAFVEREQSIDHQGLWADLLSSGTLAFNLFGDLAADLTRADRLVHAWFADAPGRVVEVRFLHSPGRLESQWLNSLRQFDAAIVLAREDGSHGIVAVDVTYHERLKAETPKPENSGATARCTSDRRRSGQRHSSASRAAATCGSRGWSTSSCCRCSSTPAARPGQVRGRPCRDNVDMAERSARYGELLADATTFWSTTLEEVRETGALPSPAARAVQDRYLPR